MANWMSNTVTFTGTKEKIFILSKYFLKAIDVQKQTDRGQFLDCNKEFHGGWMFEICIQNDLEHLEDELIVDYETKNSNNVQVLIDIAQKLDVKFNYIYDESSNHILGEYRFIDNATLECREISDEQWEQCKYWEKYIDGQPTILEYDKYLAMVKDIGEDEIDDVLSEDGYEETLDYEKLHDTLEGLEWDTENFLS